VEPVPASGGGFRRATGIIRTRYDLFGHPDGLAAQGRFEPRAKASLGNPIVGSDGDRRRGDYSDRFLSHSSFRTAYRYSSDHSPLN
jgi:hypothetical protein